MSDDPLTIQCPAKVNLALSVGSPRAEDGLHPISSWMVAVDFADTLTISRLRQGVSTFDIHLAQDAPQPFEIDWPIEKDLAYRAHALMQEYARQTLPIALHLPKRIPSGAGLGGGSSDAAGVLIGLNRLFTLDVPDEQLVELGMKLGSDVGFLVAAQSGKPSAIVGGLGERIEPIALPKPLHLVLVLPDLHCATAEVYRCFDQSKTSAKPDDANVRSLASTRPLPIDGPFNDLAESACVMEPRLGRLRERIGATVGRPVHVSGSGAAMFAVAGNGQEARALADKITSAVGVPAVAVTTSA